MTDLAGTLDIALPGPIKRAEVVLRLVPSPAPAESPAAQTHHDAGAAPSERPHEAATVAEVEYAPMYYI